MSSHRMRVSPLAVGLCSVLVAQVALAQTVQQPVVSTFSVSTTVSVPDSGGAYLGGVKSARESRQRAGFSIFGSSAGREVGATSATAHAFVHDLHAMDHAVLDEASRRGSRRRLGALRGRARTAYASLLESSPTRSAKARSGVAARSRRPTGTTEPPRDAKKAAKYWRLGQKAEQKGRASLAQVHYRLAARHGHAEAAKRLNAPATTVAAQ